MFYPADARELLPLVRRYIDSAAAHAPSPVAIIAPHAGYIYSGSIAGVAYAQFESGSSTMRRLVLLGPSHRLPLRGLALPSATHFETPLGLLAVDHAAVEKLCEHSLAQILDRAFMGEHSLEVHLPFVQVVAPNVMLVPLVVGDCSPEIIREVLELLSEDPGMALAVSSDLSHYLAYEEAQRVDAQTSRVIERLAYEELKHHDACGAVPLRGLLCYARKHGLKAKTLALANSGDSAGPRDRVVGYGAYGFYQSNTH